MFHKKNAISMAMASMANSYKLPEGNFMATENGSIAAEKLIKCQGLDRPNTVLSSRFSPWNVQALLPFTADV